MGTDTTGSPNPFLNTANWQGVDNEPTEGSDNLVKSGGVFSKIEESTVSRKTANLFSGNVVRNERVNLDGTFDTVFGAMRTDYIKVNPETLYFINSYFVSENGYATMAFFDSTKGFISSYSLNNITLFKTPSNAEYLILNIMHRQYIRDINGINENTYKNLIISEGEFINVKERGIANTIKFKERINKLNPDSITANYGLMLFIPWTSREKAILLDFNYDEDSEVGRSTIKYMSFNDGQPSEVTTPGQADYIELRNEKFYNKSADYIKNRLTNAMLVEESNVLTPYYSYNDICSNYRQDIRFCQNYYGNICDKTSLKNISPTSFIKISPYSIDTAYSFLKEIDGKKCIYYNSNEGWLTNDGTVYGRSFRMFLGKHHVCKNYGFKEYAVPYNTSIEVETSMPIYSLLTSPEFCMKHVFYTDDVNASSYNYGSNNKVTDENGDEVSDVQVGNVYYLYTEMRNASSYNQTYKINVTSNNSFIISCSNKVRFGNVNVPDEHMTGKDITLYIEIGLFINYTATKDYYIKISEPRYNLPFLCYDSSTVRVMSGQIPYIDTYMSNKYTESKDDIIDIISETYVYLNQFKGRKIVWLGTSVPNEPPFGEGKTKRYPQFVASMLGFNVVERCIGGTHMTFDPSTNKYGLSMTQEEYNTYRSQAEEDRSYEQQLDGCWDSDLFVFDHLHNDSDWLAPLKNNPDYWDSDTNTFKITETNKFDRTWAVGAFNYVIAEIFRYNPRAKIAIINDWRSEFFYDKLANRVVADMWGIPICELRMCNGKVDLTTTKDTYLKRYNGGADIKLLAGSKATPLLFQTKSAPDEQSAQATEVTEITFVGGMDEIHPGRYGRIMYAKQVARWMFNNVFLDYDTIDYWY